MLRNVILFFTLVLVALTTGRAFWMWLGENPAVEGLSLDALSAPWAGSRAHVRGPQKDYSRAGLGRDSQ
jgi:hypothetical protein